MENHYPSGPNRTWLFGQRRWSFTRGSNCKALTGKIFGVLDIWCFGLAVVSMGGGGERGRVGEKLERERWGERDRERRS